MDAKASARAKHASSQRGRARHSNRKRHPQEQQQQQQQTGKAPPQPSPDKTTAPPLPSNWSRYEEDDDLPVDDRLSDVPAVKSKGANYRDLLAEKSMFQAPDLAKGRKAQMEVHGRDLWARLTDVDNTWNIHKVSTEEDNFFTLDLDFISEELAKVDIAERLFIDPKYIPSEERVKDSMNETYDENENDTFSSQAISEASVLTKAPASPSSEEAQNSSATVYKEAGKDGGSERRWFETTATSSNIRENFTDTSKSSKLEGSDERLPQFVNKVHRVLEDTLAELPKTADNRFDTKSAEAELDALLDMLDDKGAGEALNVFSSQSLRYANSQGAANQRSEYVDVLQEDRLLDRNIDTFLGSSSKLLIGTSNTFNDTKGSSDVAVKVHKVPSEALAVGNATSVMRSSEVGVKVENVSSKLPAVSNVNSVPNLDDDFDDWLDSL